ncbi:GNAT family N-acetyltransferase [Candidatus Woesearchaeota archaeon]|nr:GNAT family N-acetyltransferase [Candidatus Woesearchaeota archaeon]
MIKHRKAEASDAEQVAKVLVENYNIKDEDEAKKVFIEELSRYNYVVALDKDKIIGMGCWRVQGLPKHQLAEIGRVATLPEYQGKGNTTAIFERMVQEADKFYKTHNTKLRKVYAYVHSSNKKAQEFYERLGLIKEAVLKDHYYDGEDEYVYSMFMD